MTGTKFYSRIFQHILISIWGGGGTDDLGENSKYLHIYWILAPGETLAIAEEQAAREALKNLMKTDEARPPLQPSSNVPLGSLDLDKKNPSAELLLKLYSESDTSSQAKQTQ